MTSRMHVSTSCDLRGEAYCVSDFLLFVRLVVTHHEGRASTTQGYWVAHAKSRNSLWRRCSLRCFEFEIGWNKLNRLQNAIGFDTLVCVWCVADYDLVF